MKTYGRVTIPTEIDFDKETIELIAKWGADAIRDSDGTTLPETIKKEVEKVYSTYFLTRGDQKWAREHEEQLQQFYLMSAYHLATTDHLELDIMRGYFKEQIRVDVLHDPKVYWEVIDRTTGEKVEQNKWHYEKETEKVILKEIMPWHEYTSVLYVNLLKSV